MKRPLALFGIIGTCALIFASCGGRVTTDVDAEAAVEDHYVDGPYVGQWCDLDAGLLDGPIDDASRFCGMNSYRDVWTYCEFVPGHGAETAWSCCTQDDFACCPTAKNQVKLGGSIVECCDGSDCSACCNGIYPGSYYGHDAAK